MTRLVPVVLFLVLSTSADAQLKFSQNVVQNFVTPNNSIACLNNGNGTHASNSYIRFYNPFTEGETAPTLTITDIRYGVETATAGGGASTQPIFVNVFSAPTGVTAFSGFTMLHQEQIQQTNVSNGGVFTVTLSTPVVHTNDPNTNLVIELFTPNGNTSGDSFFIGSNNLGQTQNCFLAAAACGLPNPSNLSNAPLSAPNMHIILDICYTNTSLTYPGTSVTQGDDFDCLFDVGLSGVYTVVTAGNELIALNPGQSLEIAFESASGTLAGTGDYFAAGSIVTSGTILPDVAPNSSIFIGSNVIVLDGFRDVFGFPVRLPVGGSAVNFGIPPGLSGTDMIVQGFILGTAPANGIYASTNGLTVQFN